MNTNKLFIPIFTVLILSCKLINSAANIDLGTQYNTPYGSTTIGGNYPGFTINGVPFEEPEAEMTVEGVNIRWYPGGGIMTNSSSIPGPTKSIIDGEVYINDVHIPKPAPGTKVSSAPAKKIETEITKTEGNIPHAVDKLVISGNVKLNVNIFDKQKDKERQKVVAGLIGKSSAPESVETIAKTIGEYEGFIDHASMEGIIEKSEVNISDDTLTITNNHPTIALQVTLTLSKLNEINCSGVVTGQINNIQSDNFIADISGDSSLIFTGTAKNMTLSLSGTSKATTSNLITDTFQATLSGATKLKGINSKAINLNLSESCNVNAMDTTTGNLTAELTGAAILKNITSSIAALNLSDVSKATIKVLDNINVTASGASVVKYSGNPWITKEQSGAAKIIHKA